MEWHLSTREQRTAVLTTHYMDEADSLGDRVAIMVAGQMACVGTAQRLKELYTTGYTLALKCVPGAAADPAIQLVASVCPGTSVQRRASAGYATLALGQTRAFSLAALFEALETQKQQLGVEAYSVAQASMEQVRTWCS